MKTTVLLCCAFFVWPVFSQEFESGGGWFRIGQIRSQLTQRPGNIQNFIYNSNQGQSERMQLPNTLTGLHLSFMYGGIINEKMAVQGEAEFINRSVVVKRNSDNYKFLLRINTYSFINTGGTVGWLKFGVSLLDYTVITIAHRSDSIVSNTLSKWVKIYDKRRMISTGSHFKLGLHVPLGKFFAFEILGVYGLNYFKTNNGLPFRANNYGLSFTAVMGGAFE
ncbi:MAG: hypothetical protein KG003_08705 [Bacteroidetes bacterium]|nr:hypothetical protein [Bacteroidota bacterium]